MKRNRKKSSTQDRNKPSRSSKLREENDLAYFVHDRVSLMREVFSVLKPKEIKAITPKCVQNLSIDALEELCLEELLGISSKRLCAILDGAEPPSDTDSSSSSSSSSASHNTESTPAPAPAAVEDVICLDSDSTHGSASNKKKRKKKKKKKRKRKSTETTTSSDSTVQIVSTEQSNAKKLTQTSSKSIQPSTSSIQTPSNIKQNDKNMSTNAAILNQTNATILNEIGGKELELFCEKFEGGKEKSRAAERVGMTVLQILEVQARARAIRAQLMKEQLDASQAGPSNSRHNNPSNTHANQEDSDSEVEIKEETADVVNLLTSSDDDDDDDDDDVDEQKPRVEELEVSVVPEIDPPAAEIKSKDKTKIKKTKTAKPNLPEPITTKILASEEKNKTPEKPSGKLNKGKANSKNKEVNVETNKDNILLHLNEKQPNSKNKLPITETQVAKPVCEEIKAENEQRESSPDFIILEDSDGENRKIVDNSRNTEIQAIDAPITTKSTKSSHINDFTITVKQKDRRKVKKDRNNVVISFSNDANANKPERDGNSFFASTQNRIIDRPSDIIEQSAKKLNSTVTKIIKERPKVKYLKSVVQKTSDKDRGTGTNIKNKDKTSDDKNIGENREEDKEKDSDGDEITLQLSDSEKMDLLEDLNPKNLDKVLVHSNADTKSSVNKNSGSSSAETDKTGQQSVSYTQDILETEISNSQIDNIDVNKEINNKNDSHSIKITKTINKDNLNVTETNIDITKQNYDIPKNNIVNEVTSKTTVISSDTTIPKTNINEIENDLSQSVNTIIRRLRVDEMVFDASVKTTNECVSANSEKATNINLTAENIANESNFLEVNKDFEVKLCESNITKEPNKDNVNDLCQSKKIFPDNSENKLNLIETSRIKDKNILSDYESDNKRPSLPLERNPNLKEQEKELTRKTRLKKKKIRKKLNRKRVSCSSSDDVVESKIVCIEDDSRVKEHEIIKESNKEFEIRDVTMSTTNLTQSSSLEGSKPTKDQDKSLQELGTSSEKNSTPIKDQKDVINNELQPETLKTHKNQSETHDIPKETETISILQETKELDAESIKCDSKAKTNDTETIEVLHETKELDAESMKCDSEGKTNDTDTIEILLETKELDAGRSQKCDSGAKTNDTETIEILLKTKDFDAESSKKCDSEAKTNDAETIEIRAEEVESNKEKDRGESVAKVPETSDTVKGIDSNNVGELPELEEGEILDDYKRELSEEGEINTDTESEIEAQDIVQETICISDEENCTTDVIDDNTIEHKDSTKKTKTKNLCKKCKRKKNLRKNSDKHSDTDKIITKNDKVLTIDELPKNKSDCNIALPNNDVCQATRIINYNCIDTLVIDNISIDSETSSDSESNNININKAQSKNSKIKDNLEIDNSISNIDLSSPNTHKSDSETLEISDDSSDCYEILSKEPTTEEIEALSEKIDRIDRIDVVTPEEIKRHELSNCSNETSNNTITKNPQNEASNSETHTINDNDPEDENISWRDRYIKSKKVTKVLKTSNILNSLRKRNLDLKKKLLESKIAKNVEEIKEIVKVLPESVEIGSIEHYNTLESSTKYVEPVLEISKLETDLKETNLTNETEIVKTTENETLVNTTIESQIVTKEMKKEAKQLLKMYKKLLKINSNKIKEKDPSKKKKKKKSKNKDGDASCSSGVTEKV